MQVHVLCLPLFASFFLVFFSFTLDDCYYTLHSPFSMNNRNNCFFQYTVSIIACSVLFVFLLTLHWLHLCFFSASHIFAQARRCRLADEGPIFCVVRSSCMLSLNSLSNLMHGSLSQLVDSAQVHCIQSTNPSGGMINSDVIRTHRLIYSICLRQECKKSSPLWSNTQWGAEDGDQILIKFKLEFRSTEWERKKSSMKKWIHSKISTRMQL